ncbi:UBX domain-containing protein 4 [Trichostrongylus colubriformis]|uniref:UBX domain-containing protein 4 n=1 Tax=Trichostrongylus colubriformis TaxID=6319 RepID=A0AAN8G6X2_TRICO
MKWFAGSVSTAVQVSRRNNALFIVFIESKNGKGEKMRDLWDKIEPSLFDCPIVGIHLMEGDEAAKQFAQIYPTPVLPASYFIDNLGKPIEVITLLKDLDYDGFFSKICNTVKAFNASVKPAPVQNDGGQQSSAASSNEVPATSSSPTSSASLEEKVQRAKMLLEQKRKAEEEAKREEEKRRELERISTGKLMQEAQQKRHEQELIEAAAQRRRDKIEAEKARERLKAQIKADREEREFRERRGRPVDASAGDMPTHRKMPKMEPVLSDRCRVQVRLPDGDNIVEEFASSDCLSALVDLIRQVGRTILVIKHAVALDDKSVSSLLRSMPPSS